MAVLLGCVMLKVSVLWLKRDRLTGPIWEMSKVALKTFRQGTANLYLQTSKIYHSAEYNFDLGRHLLFIHCRINNNTR